MPIADTGRLIVPTRTRVREVIEDAWRRAVDRAELPGTPPVAELPGVEIERPANAEYGDYASNLALKLARPYRLAPRAIAGVLADAFDERSDAPVGRPTVASPGFINMVLTESELRATLDAILESPDDWGRIVTAAPQRVNVEFVSANPTGPLHIGNARGAFVGDLLCRILEAAGNTATREYYFNDFGSQVRLLGASVWAVAQDQPVPDDGYRGSYVSDLAREMPGAVRAEAEAADDPAWPVGRWASERVRAGIETSLERLGVHFDVWTTEGSLHRDGWVERAVERLRVTGHVYERDGAAWFRSTDFGDDKDRVIRRSNGEYTYFGSDIGYVAEKFSRGFDRLIYIWGADHHGTVARVRNAAEAMGYERERVEMLLMAWVRFVRDGREISMSKRAGEFITLDELLAEVGVDAARWFFASRAASSGIDFDIELAKKQSNENPVYYVQYAHARIASILRKAEEAGLHRGQTVGDLSGAPEAALARAIVRLPEIVEDAAATEETHGITGFATELATTFHAFYRDARVVDPAAPERSQARLALVATAKTTLASALGLLGISAPESM